MGVDETRTATRQPPHARTALVTGGNRGLGKQVSLALARQGHDVWLSARDVDAGQAAAAEVTQAVGRLVRFVHLDLARPETITAAAMLLSRNGIRVEILVNNGAILEDGTLLSVSEQALKASVDINLMGAIHCIRAFAPGMVQAGWGRIVNLSSEWGSFDDGLTGPAAYSVTKAALNAVTLNVARTLPDTVKVNAVCPGWVRTKMGGNAAPRSLDEAAAGIVWAATLPDDGPTGGFFRDGVRIAW